MAYLDKMRNNGHPKITTEISGIFIHPEHGWLGASPDRLVYDPDCNEPNGLAEIKCPISIATCISTEEVQNSQRIFCVYDPETRSKRLKQSSDYYKQVQGQLAIIRRKWCDFVVWTPNWLTVECIKFNPVYWDAVFEIRSFLY